MKWTLYGIPKSIGAGVRRVLSGSVGDVLWKLLVLALLLVVAAGLLALGPVGAAVGGILLGTLLSDDVRELVGDLWNRRWTEVKTPF